MSYSFIGNIIHGKGEGKNLGFPTANLDTKEDAIEIHPGVYAAQSIVGQQQYDAILIIRENPWTIEVHLLDFQNSDIYGEEMSVEVIKKVSNIGVFKTVDELKEKMMKDIEKVKSELG